MSIFITYYGNSLSPFSVKLEMYVSVTQFLLYLESFHKNYNLQDLKIMVLCGFYCNPVQFSPQNV